MINNKEKALFMVNSIGNGGAERVCINMANELVRKGYEVEFILLTINKNNSESYELDKNIKITNLCINSSNKVKKFLKILLSVRKINKYIRKKEKNGKYSLITSHLPMSNILTRLSIVKNRAIYVFHTNMSYYISKRNYILISIVKFIFHNKKIVAVSEGVRQECIKDYGMDGRLIKTIYNPINIQEIKDKMDEPIDIKEKYFLQVGRLAKEKRQDRMLEVFSKGKFYKEYKLVFSGTGELLEEYENKAKELGIVDYVNFLGWQTNPYKWMKNAELVICTSDREAFPMTLIEALACGTKVVSSDCNFGPNEILLEDYAEYLVKPDYIDGYIEKINKSLQDYPKGNNPILQKCKVSNVIENYLDFATQKECGGD